MPLQKQEELKNQEIKVIFEEIDLTKLDTLFVNREKEIIQTLLQNVFINLKSKA